MKSRAYQNQIKNLALQQMMMYKRGMRLWSNQGPQQYLAICFSEMSLKAKVKIKEERAGGALQQAFKALGKNSKIICLQDHP
jgi:hypothetical protein